MPHIIIEHSANIEPRDARGLLLSLHHALAALPSFHLADIKSRIVPHDVFCLAGGADDAAASAGFVHTRIEIMTGRDTELRQQIGVVFMPLIIAACRLRAGAAGVIAYTLDVREMVRETYHKQIVG